GDWKIIPLPPDGNVPDNCTRVGNQLYCSDGLTVEEWIHGIFDQSEDYKAAQETIEKIFTLGEGDTPPGLTRLTVDGKEMPVTPPSAEHENPWDDSSALTVSITSSIATSGGADTSSVTFAGHLLRTLSNDGELARIGASSPASGTRQAGDQGLAITDASG